MTLRLRRLGAAVLGLALAFAVQAQLPLQQSTASQIIKIGPFVSSTDGNTATAPTIANTDVLLAKNGGTLTAKNSGGCTVDADGWYACTLDATDTNTAGRLTLKVHVSGSLPVWRDFFVYPTANYAVIFSTAPGASGGLPTTDASNRVVANVTQFGGAAITSSGGIPAVNTTQIGGTSQTARDVGGAVPAAVAGAAGGLLIAGNNAPTTFTGGAASGATPATAGLTLVGGAASATGGGVAAPGFFTTGGAGAASTNGAATGFLSSAGGTTTVSGNDGAKFVGTGNGNAIGVTAAGTGLVFSTAVNANVTQFGSVNGTFSGGRAEANMTHIAGAVVAAGTAQLGVNVVNFGGNAGTFASGRPEVNTTHWAGTPVGSATVRSDLINIGGAAVSTSTAQLGVNTVNAGGTTWNSGAITVNTFASDAITAAKVAADVGSEIMASLPTGNGPFPGIGMIDQGTAQTADATSITLRSGFSAGAVNMVGVSAWITSSTNGKFARCASTAYNDTTKVLTCTGLGEAPTGTVVYALYATPGSALGAEVVEPNGSITRKCVEAIALAYMAGNVSTSSGTSTYKDPSNTTTRIVGTVAGSNRGTITITCPP